MAPHGDSAGAEALPADDAPSPVYAFLRQPSLADFPGHLAAVFFLSGCNFRCGFCHNPDLLAPRREALSWGRLREACARFAGDWVSAAVVTGGEPTLHPGLLDLVRFFRRLGWAVKLDTNGSRPEVLSRCLPLVDYVAMDVKTAPSQYARLTGCDDAADVLRSLALIKAAPCAHEFRTTVVESLHSDPVMDEVGEAIRGARRYAIQAFVPRPDLPDARLAAEPRTSPARLAQLRARMAPFADEVLVRGEFPNPSA